MSVVKYLKCMTQILVRLRLMIYLLLNDMAPFL